MQRRALDEAAPELEVNDAIGEAVAPALLERRAHQHFALGQRGLPLVVGSQRLTLQLNLNQLAARVAGLEHEVRIDLPPLERLGLVEHRLQKRLLSAAERRARAAVRTPPAAAAGE